MEHKYDTLIKILDKLRSEAPTTYKRYNPSEDNPEEIQYARSLSFIHLLLKVKFGISDFIDRHQQITDGPGDGGLDAFHFDNDRKKLYFIQSKLGSNSTNFDKKSIEPLDLMKIEVTRITKGFEDDSNSNKFNDKILQFQNKLRQIRDIAKYEYIVLLLGNTYKYNDEQIRKLIDNNIYEVYNSTIAYEKLIFPLTTGTYYDPEEIEISIELTNKEHPKLKQLIETDFGNFNVTAIFVPTIEIGRILSKYKNAILKYNPRNFLSLQKKSVNANIKSSIVDQQKNNFALLNNGITILSDNISIQESTGTQNVGQLILTRPQILNGGQTAFTLSTIYDDFYNKENNPLIGKEVLIKVITPINSSLGIDSKFIDLISNATNQQNEVSEADRRSNNDLQVAIQKKLYDDYGYFYERKTGEFHDGILNHYIDSELIIDRLKFIKSYWAYIGEASAARRSSEAVAFREDNFFKLLNDCSKCKEMFFSYIIFTKLEKIENAFRKKSDSVAKYGYSLLYGKWAVTMSIALLKPVIPDDYNELCNEADRLIEMRLNAWKEFDKYIEQKNAESKYFESGVRNFELYYKIDLLTEDIKEYFLQ
jgi:hypothetical protein